MDADVEVKVVSMWSYNNAGRAHYDRKKVLEKFRQLVERPGPTTHSTYFGAAQFVRGVTFDLRMDFMDELFALVGVEAPRMRMRTKHVKALFQ